MLRAHIAAEQVHTARRLELIAASAFTPLQAIARRRPSERLPTDREYRAAVSLLKSGLVEYELLGYVDSHDVCRFVSSAEETSLVGADLSVDPVWGRLIARVRANPQLTSSSSIGTQRNGERAAPKSDELNKGDKGSEGDEGDAVRLMIVVPIGAAAGEDEQAPEPMIVARARIDAILKQMTEGPFANAYAVEIRNADGPFYFVNLPRSRQVTDPEPLDVLDNRWFLSLKPTEQFISAWSARKPLWVLVGGTIISVLIGATLLQVLHHRWRDADLTRRHVLSLESVNQIASAISGGGGDGGGGKASADAELLERLAAEPRQLLGVTRSVIALYDPARDLVNIVSSSSDPPLTPDLPKTHSASEPRCMPMVLKDRQVVVSNDVEHDAAIFHIELLRKLEIRSLMMFPLVGQDRVIGLWIVTCDRPHAFRDVEVPLARLWASQIALTLVNSHYFNEMTQALEAQKKLTDQRDTLAAVNAAIFQAATLEESTRKIADLAPRALHCDMCLVNLLSRPGQMTVAAATGAYAERLVGATYDIEGTNAQQVLRSRQALFIEDASDNPTLHPRFRQMLRARSIVYVPIFRSDANPIGMLTLVRHAPTTYDDEQRRLIEIFGRRAAAALENVILHQQARRDADTKAMLLRELNHRVKNNLAGIISLLTIGQAQLPEKAQQWLDRAVERIAMIARAHELFAGGVGKVSLDKLIAQMLPSLSVAKPAGVEVQTDVARAAVFLRTDRAVSLAMVLHELCYNAIVHGMQDNRRRGVVRLAARVDHSTHADRAAGLVIDVANDMPADDDGAHGADLAGVGVGGAAGPTLAVLPRVRDLEQAAASSSGGLGLQLVAGLVRRELRGTFAIASRPDERRTVATVEFPLLPEELQEEDSL